MNSNLMNYSYRLVHPGAIYCSYAAEAALATNWLREEQTTSAAIAAPATEL